jgi:hypothetical protein
VWITNIATLIVVAILLYRIKRLTVDIASVKYELKQFRARQTKIKIARGSIPIVDAVAKTNRRDTSDLPSTGRMSQAIHRRRHEVDSPNDDS